jgi:hypothetical protein
MLSPAKHFTHTFRINNPSGASKMLRGAQHDVLFYYFLKYVTR